MQEFHIIVNSDGQGLLPQALCESLSAKPGDEIVVLGNRHDMRVYRSPDVAKRVAAVHKLQQLARELAPPDVSMVDELIAERRAEAAREEAEIRHLLEQDKKNHS